MLSDFPLGSDARLLNRCSVCGVPFRATSLRCAALGYSCGITAEYDERTERAA